MLAIVPNVTAAAATGFTTLRAPLFGMAARPYPAAPATGCSGTAHRDLAGVVAAERDGQDVLGHPGR